MHATALFQTYPSFQAQCALSAPISDPGGPGNHQRRPWSCRRRPESVTCVGVRELELDASAWHDSVAAFGAAVTLREAHGRKTAESQE